MDSSFWDCAQQETYRALLLIVHFDRPPRPVPHYSATYRYVSAENPWPLWQKLTSEQCRFSPVSAANAEVAANAMKATNFMAPS
jgi:hypothetical protein